MLCILIIVNVFIISVSIQCKKNSDGKKYKKMNHIHTTSRKRNNKSKDSKNKDEDLNLNEENAASASSLPLRTDLGSLIEENPLNNRNVQEALNRKDKKKSNECGLSGQGVANEDDPIDPICSEYQSGAENGKSNSVYMKAAKTKGKGLDTKKTNNSGRTKMNNGVAASGTIVNTAEGGIGGTAKATLKEEGAGKTESRESADGSKEKETQKEENENKKTIQTPQVISYSLIGH